MSKLRVIPLGGVEEVGKNSTVFEYGRDIIVVDLGLDFPGPDLPGVDYILPDVSYLEKNKKRIRGIVTTHGHLDHIGAIPYLIERIGNPPVYATKLAAGLIRSHLEERGLVKLAKLVIIDPARPFSLGVFKINCFRVNHNIPDSIGLAIESAVGTVIHTGDFKFDPSPVDQGPAEKGKIASFGRRGVLALLSDSTNAEIPGKTLPEKEVGRMIDSIFSQAQGRIIFTTFSTLISRIQQVIQVSLKYKRKIAVAGLSIEKSIDVAAHLGYLKIPAGLFVRLEKIKQVPDRNLVILASGAQGVEGSAMDRISRLQHRLVKIKEKDMVVFSSSAIPGNELAIHRVMDGIIDQGAKIIYEPRLGLGIHSSGHAFQEDLKEMIRLTRPKFFIPIEGEHYMTARHIELAEKVGLKKETCFMMYNGQVLEIDRAGYAKILPERVVSLSIVVEHEKVRVLKEEILKERRRMAESGICVIMIRGAGKKMRADIASRGLDLAPSTIESIRRKARELIGKRKLEKIEEALSDSILTKTGKKPIVIVHLT